MSQRKASKHYDSQSGATIKRIKYKFHRQDRTTPCNNKGHREPLEYHRKFLRMNLQLANLRWINRQLTEQLDTKLRFDKRIYQFMGWLYQAGYAKPLAERFNEDMQIRKEHYPGSTDYTQPSANDMYNYLFKQPCMNSNIFYYQQQVKLSNFQFDEEEERFMTDEEEDEGIEENGDSSDLMSSTDSDSDSEQELHGTLVETNFQIAEDPEGVYAELPARHREGPLDFAQEVIPETSDEDED